MNNKIIPNPEWSKEEHKEFAEIIKNINGQCPCVLFPNRNEDTLCMCKAFREQEEGLCHCERFLKVKYE